jgi:hypothetical protein
MQTPVLHLAILAAVLFYELGYQLGVFQVNLKQGEAFLGKVLRLGGMLENVVMVESPRSCVTISLHSFVRSDALQDEGKTDLDQQATTASPRVRL